jgi:hypothetical protein
MLTRPATLNLQLQGHTPSASRTRRSGIERIIDVILKCESAVVTDLGANPEDATPTALNGRYAIYLDVETTIPGGDIDKNP